MLIAQSNILRLDMFEYFEKILRRGDDVQKSWRHIVFGIICEEDYFLLKRFEKKGDDAFVDSDVGLKIADYCVEFDIVFHTIQIKLLKYYILSHTETIQVISTLSSFFLG